MSALLSSITGGGGLPKLAPDLDFVSNSSSGKRSFSAIDATGSLTNVINETGKFEFSDIAFTGLLHGDMNKIKLTIDGVDIWDEDPLTPPSGTSITLMINGGYEVKESITLAVQMATDTSISGTYSLRPTL